MTDKQREAFEREERYIVIKLKDLDSRQRDLIDMVIDGADK